MAGCKPNQCYNILTLYGYLVPYTCNTTIPHTTPTHTNPNTHNPLPSFAYILAVTAPLMGIFVLGLWVGVVCSRVVLHVYSIK